jgi:hypothetical protein
MSFSRTITPGLRNFETENTQFAMVARTFPVDHPTNRPFSTYIAPVESEPLNIWASLIYRPQELGSKGFWQAIDKQTPYKIASELQTRIEESGNRSNLRSEQLMTTFLLMAASGLIQDENKRDAEAIDMVAAVTPWYATYARQRLDLHKASFGVFNAHLQRQAVISVASIYSLQKPR